MSKITYKSILVIICFALTFSTLNSVAKEKANDPYQPKNYVQLKHPEWSKNVSIYEVNIRQYTPEGTFKAFEKHLPRLKELGVDILWLMPIHPIGEKNRKGNIGSYYSVKDYYAVNPEFGSLDEFKSLVNKIHDMGMYVIIDWVANHSAWDNPLTIEHPEWYTKDYDGNFQPTPWYDWDDVIDFDYNHPGIRKYMTDVLKYWVKETNIDGYRCDVAGFMPTDFWDNARKELDEIKPVFMLAEWDSRDLHKHAFDMSYSWELHAAMHELVMNNGKFYRLYEHFAHNSNTFPRNAYRMNFVDNHDKNSWEGTQFSMFGEALDACIVLTATAEGMPLIYSGQEAGLDKQLAFFEKDEIEWKDHYLFDFYKSLLHLKKENKALWNGKFGGDMIPIVNNGKKILSFAREKDGNKVVVVINFNDEEAEFEIKSNIQKGDYTELFSKQKVKLTGQQKIKLPKYGYKVYYL
ncbi:alpha-amlyase [Marinifilum breve]|uniref:Alpha-amlyase n=2 Tax=Marinifilum breve TaxID=2184082 RepID=A0A2V4A3X2_9BACT|nr:alpha-amlyase [Marinifilum breve]